MAFTFYRTFTDPSWTGNEVAGAPEPQLAGTPPEHQHLSQPYPRQNAMRTDTPVPLPRVSSAPLPASTPLSSPQISGGPAEPGLFSALMTPPPPLTINTSQPLDGPAMGGGEATPPGIPRFSDGPMPRQETWSVAYGNPPPWMRVSGETTPPGPMPRQETWSVAYGNPPPWMREAGDTRTPWQRMADDYPPGPAIGGGEATPPGFYEMHPELLNRPMPRY